MTSSEDSTLKETKNAGKNKRRYVKKIEQHFSDQEDLQLLKCVKLYG